MMFIVKFIAFSLHYLQDDTIFFHYLEELYNTNTNNYINVRSKADK